VFTWNYIVLLKIYYIFVVIKILALVGETVCWTSVTDFFTDSVDRCLLQTELDAVSTPASAIG
jgi:hypothetical protein